MSDLAFGEIGFLQKPRQDALKSHSKSRPRNKQKEDKKIKAVSAFFSKRKGEGMIPPSQAGPVARRGLPSWDESAAESAAGYCNQNTLARSPTSPQESLKTQRHEIINELATIQASGGEIRRPETRCSSSTSYFSRLNSRRSPMMPDQGLDGRFGGSVCDRSSTAESTRNVLTARGIYRGLGDSYQQQSGEHTQQHRAQGGFKHDTEMPYPPGSDRPHIRRDTTQIIRYHDRGVMVSEDYFARVGSDIGPSIKEDDLSRNPDSPATRNSYKEVSPVLRATEGEKPCGRKDENGTRKENKESGLSRVDIAAQAYIHRKEPILECTEDPPPRPKPPKLSVVERLEERVDRESQPIIYSAYVGVNIEKRAPQEGKNDTCPSYYYYGSGTNTETTHLAPAHNLPEASTPGDTVSMFRRGLGQLEPSVSTPLVVHSWGQDEFVTLQPLELDYHRSLSGFSHLANNLLLGDPDPEPTNVPESARYETMEGFIGRIEQDVLEKPGNYGKGPPMGSSPDRSHSLRGSFERQELINQAPPSNLEIRALREPTRGLTEHSKLSRGPGFGRSSAIVESFLGGGWSRFGIEARASIDDNASLSRFWRPNPYDI